MPERSASIACRAVAVVATDTAAVETATPQRSSGASTTALRARFDGVAPAAVRSA